MEALPTPACEQLPCQLALRAFRGDFIGLAGSRRSPECPPDKTATAHNLHLNSIAIRDIPRIAELIKGAQSRDVHVTTEAYPYGAGSTVVGAELFRGNWRERMGGATASDIELGRAVQ